MTEPTIHRRAAVRDRYTKEILVPCSLTRDDPPRLSLREMYLGQRHPKSLRHADLRGADLFDADVTGQDLSDADLTGANFVGTRYDRFTHWPLGFAPERLGAVLVPPDLSGAKLEGADLSHQDLSGANLKGAILIGANLQHADLTKAQLQGANVAGADLRGANLVDAVLAGIRADENTQWPDGFDLDATRKPSASPPTLDRLVQLLKTLADPARLKIIGLVASDEATVEEIADTLELSEATVSHHLTRLKEEGLVTVRPDGTRRLHRTDTERLNQLLQSLPKEAIRLARGGVDPATFEKKVIDTFFDGDRLRELPARSMKKQRIVLQRIVETFDRSERYTEKQVSEKLKVFHPDFATLRRYLVDYRFMARENNIYWRL